MEPQSQINKEQKRNFLKTNLDFLSSVNLKEKIVFTKNLQIMIRTGLSLSAAMKTLAVQTNNKYFQKILFDIQINIEKGNSFGDSLKKYPKVFNEIFISMIESGELSGNLEEVLDYLQTQMKKNHELISKVKGAMIYPTIVLIAMFGIGTAMMIFVIPKLISIFDEFKADLPAPTKILIATSNFLTHNGLLSFITLVVLIVAINFFHRTEIGKKIFHGFYLKAPILGPITRKINLARFSRTLSSLIKTDIPIIQSFGITSKTLGNVYYKKALAESVKEIEKGVTISQSISKYPKLFTPMVLQMLTVGEESGEVDEVLMEIADFYEEEIDQIMKNLPQIIEPVLILVLGFGVGAMAVAIIMPLYSLTESI